MVWMETERRRLERPGRMRAIGGGRKPALETEEILLMTLLRLRLGLKMEDLGRLFGIDKSTASRYFQKSIRILQQIDALKSISTLIIRKRGKSIKEIFQEYPELELFLNKKPIYFARK